MRIALRIARYAGCGLLIVAGGLGWLLMLLVLIANDEDDVRVTAAVLFVMATALIVGGLRWLPKRSRSAEPEAPPPPPEVSRAAARAYEQLQRCEPVVLYPRRRRWAILLVLAGALFAGSVFVFVGMPHVLPAAGILLFGSATAMCVIQFVPRWSHLRIAPDGLVIRNSARTTRLAWNDVERFTTYEVYHQYGSVTMVGFDRRDLTPEGQSLFQTITRGMTGVDGSLPDNYGMRHEELAALLSEARERYATERGPSPSLLADLELQRRAAAVPRDRIPVVTVALALVCAAAFVVEVSAYGLLPDTAELAAAGGASREALADGAWWTLLVANVLHTTPWHLVFNLLVLLALGVLLEREVGWARFGLLCLAGGLASTSLGVLLQQGAGVVGVSGVVYAIAAWALLRDVHRTRMVGITAWLLLPAGVIYTFFVPGVSIGGHLGGLLAGFAVGYLFEHGPARRAEPVDVRAP
jgi:membrane associated rhomboid family serine protease